MSSPPDRDQGAPARQQQTGISIRTLIIASIGSASAAFVVSRVWGPGTLIGAAVTPIIVALVSEGVRKPVTKVAEIVPVPPVVASAYKSNPSASSPPQPPAAPAPGSPTGPPETTAPLATPAPRPRAPVPARPAMPAGSRTPGAPTGGPQTPPSAEDGYVVYGKRRQFRLVAATAAAAFVIGVAAYVVVDLAGGGSGTLVPNSRDSRRAKPVTVTTPTNRTETVVTVPAQTTRTVTTPSGGQTPPASTTPTTPTQPETTPETTPEPTTTPQDATPPAE